MDSSFADHWYSQASYSSCRCRRSLLGWWRKQSKTSRESVSRTMDSQLELGAFKRIRAQYQVCKYIKTLMVLSLVKVTNNIQPVVSHALSPGCCDLSSSWVIYMYVHAESACGPGACIQERDGTNKETASGIEAGNCRVLVTCSNMPNAVGLNKYLPRPN